MITQTITNEQKIKVTVDPRSANGNPAPIDGDPTLTVVTGNSTFEPVPDEPKSFFLISEDGLGDTDFFIEADADLGGGVVSISETIRLTVVGAQATTIGVTLGTPEPK